MAKEGTTQGNLIILKLHHKDTKKYSYIMYYYQCECLLCGKRVILPATNLRKYQDCGNHWKEKITKKVEYLGSEITIKYIKKKTGLNIYYIGQLLRKGYTAEQIIDKSYPRKPKTKPTVASIAAKELGIHRSTMSWRLKHGWSLKKKDGKYVMSKKK